MHNSQKQENRTANLILENIDEYVIYGDIIITNSLNIKNSTLIISGSLIFTDDCIKIISKNCNIFAESIIFGTEEKENNNPSISIEDTDIFVQNFSSTFPVITDGIIEIQKDLTSSNVLSCLHLFVGGYTVAKSIQTLQDAYFCNNCECNTLSARDVVVNGVLNLNGYSLNNFGNTYARDGILNQGTYN